MIHALSDVIVDLFDDGMEEEDIGEVLEISVSVVREVLANEGRIDTDSDFLEDDFAGGYL